MLQSMDLMDGIGGYGSLLAGEAAGIKSQLCDFRRDVRNGLISGNPAANLRYA